MLVVVRGGDVGTRYELMAWEIHASQRSLWV